jgi:hypothetical protein
MKALGLHRPIFLVVAVVGASLPAFGGNISFTCAANIDATQAGTCASLNVSLAGLYASTFTDVNASIYIQYGTTGLGASNDYLNTVTYSAYLAALTAHESGANDIAAVGSLSPTNPVVPGEGVAITSALAAALGLSGGIGIDASQGSCTLGNAGCYNGIITISNTASLFYRSGVQSPSAYDFFSVVEHETDEILGTSSCLTTSAGSPATSVGCTNGGTGVGAADLFRYSAPGTRSYLSTANGTTAYFSTDGGNTNIAGYNNSPNGADYGDFDSASLRIQNAFGTPGTGGLDITNDGGSEIKLLDAVGYNLTSNSSTATPEPGTLLLFGTSFAMFGGFAFRRHPPVLNRRWMG